jgi:aspartate aminotransferase
VTRSFARRIHEIEESKSVRLAAVVAELRREGKKVISLNVGEPDFNTPMPILEATKQALVENKTRYSLVEGILELREAIAARVNAEHPHKVTTKNILVSNGSKQILYNIFQTILDPGDEVIVPVPYWVTFPESIKLAGGKPVPVACQGIQLSLDAIKAALTPRTKAIIINSPNNPTGAVYPEADLRELALMARAHDLFIISDEAYDSIIYDGLKPVRIGAFSEDAFERTISVRSFSKSHCMTGFRIGYMIANDGVIKAVNKLQSHLTGNNCTFAQYGALAALEMDQTGVREMVELMQKRRDLSFSLFSQIFPIEKPQGAFYLFADVKHLLGNRFKNDIELCEFFLREAQVALLPGDAFGAPGYIRICFAPGEDDITEAFERIKKVL